MFPLLFSHSFRSETSQHCFEILTFCLNLGWPTRSSLKNNATNLKIRMNTWPFQYQQESDWCYRSRRLIDDKNYVVIKEGRKIGYATKVIDNHLENHRPRNPTLYNSNNRGSPKVHFTNKRRCKIPKSLGICFS